MSKGTGTAPVPGGRETGDPQQQLRQDYTAGAGHVYDTAVPAFEDTTNSVAVVEQGRFQAVRITTGSVFQYIASNNTTPSGAIGDYLHGIIVTRGMAYITATPTTDHFSIYDSQSASPAADIVGQFGPDTDGSETGAAALGTLNIPAGTFIPMGVVSTTGGWCVKIFGSGPTELIFVGRFTNTAF